MINFSKTVSVLFLIMILNTGCAYHNIEKAKDSPDNKNKFLGISFRKSPFLHGQYH